MADERKFLGDRLMPTLNIFERAKNWAENKKKKTEWQLRAIFLLDVIFFLDRCENSLGRFSSIVTEQRRDKDEKKTRKKTKKRTKRKKRRRGGRWEERSGEEWRGTGRGEVVSTLGRKENEEEEEEEEEVERKKKKVYKIFKSTETSPIARSNKFPLTFYFRFLW